MYNGVQIVYNCVKLEINKREFFKAIDFKQRRVNFFNLTGVKPTTYYFIIALQESGQLLIIFLFVGLRIYVLNQKFPGRGRASGQL